jgi:protein-disulfide isomerase
VFHPVGPEQRRDNSQRLDQATNGATLVEFLDFQCESCGAAYPLVEQIRERFQGRFTYVIRYFPKPPPSRAGSRRCTR